MESQTLSEKADAYLKRLCLEIESRRVGSAGNRAATDFFASAVGSFGFEVATPTFDCIDWIADGAECSVDGERFEVLTSPYSLGCQVRAALAIVSTVEELETAEVGDKVLLLRGELTAGQLMPKNFPFSNPDQHKRIIEVLSTSLQE